jgi:hypothetical protein
VAQFDKMRAQSNRFAIIVVAEIGYSAVLGLLRHGYWSKSFAIVYYILLFAVPFICNLGLYLSAHKQASPMGKHYALTAQILVLFFSLKFMI